MLEAGMALIAVNLPSLQIFSISLKTMEVIHSVRSLLELSFLWGSSSHIARNASEAPTTSGTDKIEKPGSFSTRPSASSNVLQQNFP